MPVAPLLHQLLEFSVVPVGQDNLGGDEQITSATGLRQPLALEAEGATARGVFRDRQFDRAAQRRHANLAAEHRFVKGDRQFDLEIAAVDLEEGMRRDVDGDQQVARAVARRGFALPLQPDLLAVGDDGWNLDVELLAGRQADALVRALDRLLQRHRHGNVEIEIEPDAAGIEFKLAAAGARATRRTAEHAVQDFFKVAAAHAAGPRAAGADGIGLEAARTTGAAARVAAGKALEARLAFGVDFAAVKLLALVLVANDLVCGIDLGKARRGLRVVLVAVGVVLLGELAIGALDRRRAGAPRHPQDLIGVAHPSRLLHGKYVFKIPDKSPALTSSGISVAFLQLVSRHVITSLRVVVSLYLSVRAFRNAGNRPS